MKFSWQLSKSLLMAIINDQVSDRFVCELIWERLYYLNNEMSDSWLASNKTPPYWSSKFIQAPQIISERPASIHLTRSIKKENKQGLKEFLNFKGYKVNELYPRKTRRATAVNWLIFWSDDTNNHIFEKGEMPDLNQPPINPAKGHIEDLPIN